MVLITSDRVLTGLNQEEDAFEEIELIDLSDDDHRRILRFLPAKDPPPAKSRNCWPLISFIAD